MNITKSVPSNVPQMPICIGMDLHSDNVVVSACTTEVTENGLRTKWLATKRFSIRHFAFF